MVSDDWPLGGRPQQDGRLTVEGKSGLGFAECAAPGPRPHDMNRLSVVWHVLMRSPLQTNTKSIEHTLINTENISSSLVYKIGAGHKSQTFGTRIHRGRNMFSNPHKLDDSNNLANQFAIQCRPSDIDDQTASHEPTSWEPFVNVKKSV